MNPFTRLQGAVGTVIQHQKKQAEEAELQRKREDEALNIRAREAGRTVSQQREAERRARTGQMLSEAHRNSKVTK